MISCTHPFLVFTALGKLTFIPKMRASRLACKSNILFCWCADKTRSGRVGGGGSSNHHHPRPGNRGDRSVLFHLQKSDAPEVQECPYCLYSRLSTPWLFTRRIHLLSTSACVVELNCGWSARVFNDNNLEPRFGTRFCSTGIRILPLKETINRILNVTTKKYNSIHLSI